METISRTTVTPFLLVLIFLIPLQNIYLGKIPSLGAGLNIINILMCLALFFVIGIKDTSFKNDLNKYILWMAVVYICSWVNAGLYIGSYDTGSFQILKDLLFSYLFFFVVYKSCNNIKQLKIIFMATILPLPYMFKVYYTNLSWMGFSHYSDKLRLNGGTFMNLGSNEINAFYATYTFVILSVAFVEKSRWLRFTMLLFVVMNFYCLVYGFSRGAYISVLGGLVVWAVVNSRVKMIFATFLLLSFIGLVGIQVLPKAATERFQTTFAEEGDRDESAQSRFEFWKLALEHYLQNPVLGIGFKNFPKVNPLGLDTHNYYIKVLVENGLVGIVALLMFLRASWKKIQELNSIASSTFLKALAAGMMPCMVAILIGNLFGDRFTHYPLISYFFVYMGMVMRGIEISRIEKPLKLESI